MYVHSINNDHSFDLKGSQLVVLCTDLPSRKAFESSLIRHHQSDVVNLNPGLSFVDPFLSTLLLRSRDPRLLDAIGSWT